MEFGTKFCCNVVTLQNLPEMETVDVAVQNRHRELDVRGGRGFQEIHSPQLWHDSVDRERGFEIAVARLVGFYHSSNLRQS